MKKNITLYSGGSTVRFWMGVEKVTLYENRIAFDYRGKHIVVIGTWILEED
jgi:hypothetical protein